MNPTLLCELVAALMFEYLDRASSALSRETSGGYPPPRHFFDEVLLPVWMGMLEDLELPLEPPVQRGADTEARLLKLASLMRSTAQDLAVQKELDEDEAVRRIERAFDEHDRLPPAGGTLN